MSKDRWRRLSILLFIALVGAVALLPPWSPLSVTTPATPEGRVLEEVTPSSVTFNGSVSGPISARSSNPPDAPTPAGPPAHREIAIPNQYAQPSSAALREPEHTQPPSPDTSIAQVSEQDVAEEDADDKPLGIAAPSPQPNRTPPS